MATQFDIMRDRIARQAKKQQQQLEEKTAQRFALQGNLQSGAYEEAQRQNVQSVQEQAGQQLQEVEAAEQADLARKEEIQKEREFQAGESEKGRQLTREQTAAQQQFAREERIGSQQFSAAENEAMRKFQAGERMSAQDFQALEAARQRQFATQERLGSQQYGTQERLGAQQYGTQERIGAEQASARENELQRRFQTGERLSAQDFTELQAMNQRKFQAEQAGMDRAARRQELDDQLAQGKWSEQLKADIQREGIAADSLFKQQNLNQELTAMKVNAINNIRDTLLQGLSEEETTPERIAEIMTNVGNMVRFKPDGTPIINGISYGQYAENQTSLQSRPTTSLIAPAAIKTIAQPIRGLPARGAVTR